MNIKKTSKAELINKANKDLDKNKQFSEIWSPQDKLALACRVLHMAGHTSGSGLAGQITAREFDSSQNYYTQQLGLGLDEIATSNILLVDSDLNVIKGAGIPNPANRFHSWIYQARADVNCIIHTHPLYSSALSMLEIPLCVSHMDGAILYGDIAFLENWPGVPVGNEEGEIISAALGQKKAILLSHHGLLTAGSSIEEATMLALQFERAAQMQLIAMAAGQIKPISKALGDEAHKWMLSSNRSNMSFSYFARRVLKIHPEVLS